MQDNDKEKQSSEQSEAPSLEPIRPVKPSLRRKKETEPSDTARSTEIKYKPIPRSELVKDNSVLEPLEQTVPAEKQERKPETSPKTEPVVKSLFQKLTGFYNGLPQRNRIILISAAALLLAALTAAVFMSLSGGNGGKTPAISFRKSGQKGKTDLAAKKLSKEERIPAPYENTRYRSKEVASFTINIEGGRAFKRVVSSALNVIYQADKGTYARLRRYVYTIRSGATTGFAVEEDVPTITLTERTAFKSVGWCAGAIAHQLYHSMYYYDTLIKKEEILRKGFGNYSNEELRKLEYMDPIGLEKMERAADKFQISVMTRINADTREINLIRNRPPYKYSLTHDGR